MQRVYKASLHVVAGTPRDLHQYYEKYIEPEHEEEQKRRVRYHSALLICDGLTTEFEGIINMYRDAFFNVECIVYEKNKGQQSYLVSSYMKGLLGLYDEDMLFNLTLCIPMWSPPSDTDEEPRNCTDTVIHGVQDFLKIAPYNIDFTHNDIILLTATDERNNWELCSQLYRKYYEETGVLERVKNPYIVVSEGFTDEIYNFIKEKQEQNAITLVNLIIITDGDTIPVIPEDVHRLNTTIFMNGYQDMANINAYLLKSLYPWSIRPDLHVVFIYNDEDIHTPIPLFMEKFRKKLNKHFGRLCLLSEHRTG